MRGRLGEDEVADAYVAAAEEVAPEADVPGIMASAPIGDYRRGSEKYLRFKYASNRLIPREVSERIMDRLFAEHVSADEAGFIRELYLSTDEIVELRRCGHSIAGHSISHPSLPQLDESEQEREIAGAADWLGGLLGEPLAWFNYPYGDHDERSERVCERLGLSIAYSTRPPTDWDSPRGALSRPARGHVLPAGDGRGRTRRPGRRDRLMATPIVVPKLNENDDEVIVVELADGYVEPGQALFSVETSKAVQEVEAEAAGFVLWNARVGDRIAVLVRARLAVRDRGGARRLEHRPPERRGRRPGR